jgi:uncharacterized protein (DUF934 family)
MEIIRDRRIVQDHWQHVLDDESRASAQAPRDGDIVVSLRHWKERKRELVNRPGGVGVRLGVADAVDEIADDLDHIDLVVLEFPAFTEGRGYSQARLLRDACAYAGEIRAVGDVSRDRLAFMERCGINAYELREDCDPKDALNGFAEVSDVYQPASDAAPSIPAQRGWRGA